MKAVTRMNIVVNIDNVGLSTDEQIKDNKIALSKYAQFLFGSDTPCKIALTYVEIDEE